MEWITCTARGLWCDLLCIYSVCESKKKINERKTSLSAFNRLGARSKWFRSKHIYLSGWPSKSPDQSLIENLAKLQILVSRRAKLLETCLKRLVKSKKSVIFSFHFTIACYLVYDIKSPHNTWRSLVLKWRNSSKRRKSFTRHCS